MANDTEALARKLGRRNAQQATSHLHRSLNHLEAVIGKLRPVLGVSDLVNEAAAVQDAVAAYLDRVKTRLSELERRNLGPTLNEVALAVERRHQPVRKLRLRKLPPYQTLPIEGGELCQ